MKYSDDLKEQILNEVEETKCITAVARKHKIPDSTIHTWLKKQHKTLTTKEKYNQLKIVKKENADLKLKNAILEDLLKKTHHLWVSD